MRPALRGNDSAVSGLQDIGLDMAQAAALTAGLGTMVGATPSQVAQASIHSAFSSMPNALAGYAGRLGATAIGAAPSTPVGKMSSAVVGGILGSVAGPIGGLLGGLIGPTVVGLAEDALGVRSMEDVRDAMEDTVGTFSGRRMGQAFSDAYDKTKTVTPSFNYAVDSMSMSPTQKNVAKTSFSNALGKSFSSMSKDKLGDVARNIGITPAAAYAGAMANLGSFGVETDPTGNLQGAIDSISDTIGEVNEAFSNAMSSFGGPTQSAPSADRAAEAMSNAMNEAAQQAAESASDNSPSADTSSSPSDSPSDGSDGEQGDSSSSNDNSGGGSGDNDSGGGDGDNGGGFGDNNGGPDGGSDSQGTGEGQAGDGTGSGANGQNDSGDDGGDDGGDTGGGW